MNGDAIDENEYLMKLLKNFLRPVKRHFSAHRDIEWLKQKEVNDYKSPKVNLGQIQSRQNAQKRIGADFSEIEFQVFSQFGDDGIIQWFVSNLPFQNKTFIEFGVEDYREANTRFLLVNNYWSGFVIDGDSANIASHERERLSNFFDIVGMASFITKDNINDLMRSSGFGGPVDILSVDIDGNDYWVWKAIDSIDPILIICEYNCLFGFESSYTVPYEADFVRGRNGPFSLYGTSLLSANDLAESRGYTFVGCNSAGNNAYFLKSNWLQHLPKSPVTLAEGFRFSSFSETRNENGRIVRGADRVRHLEGLPVVNTRSMREEPFNSKAIIQSLQEHKKLARY